MMTRKIFAIVAALIVLSAFVFGQARTGNIYGSVADNEGNALPGVTVTVTGSLISAMSVVTSAAGNFRFLSLPPAGDYVLKCELQGFKGFVRENLIVAVGQNLDLKIVMELGRFEEEVTVVAQTPVVDTKKSTIQANLNREALQVLPSARDPWVILELAPGVMVDRENIGGSESGQQSSFNGRGDSGDNAQWNLDGVNISDPAAVGASPMYYDFDMFEEMNIQTAANDVTAVTGGININFVTPRGGNKLKGAARFFITDKKLQSENLPSDVAAEDLAGNKVHSVYDYGFNLGGPIVKDKLWFWGSYGVQDINQFNITGQRDDTNLTSYNLKLNAQLGVHRIEAYGNYSIKEKDGRRRTGGYLDEPGATWIQNGPGWLFKLQDEMTFGPNFYLSAKAALNLNGFTFEPKGGRTIVYRDMNIDKAWNSYQWYETNRPVWYGELQGNYFLEDFLGADHEWKFGAEYKNCVVDSATGWGNGVQARLRNGVPYEVRMYNNFYEKFYANRFSGYLQDIIDLGRLTLNLGVRYDRQWGGIMEGSNIATDVDLMRNIGGVDYNWGVATQQPGDFPFTWNMISPRAGFSFDIFGTGKTLLKGNFSIYGSQFDATAAYTMFFLFAYHRFAWNDANGDLQVQSDELVYRSTVDTTPLAAQTTDLLGQYFDSDVSPQKSMEFLVGVEHELTADFGLGVNFQYRRMYDFNWNKLIVLDYLTGDEREVQDSDMIPAGEINGQTFWDINWDLVESTYTNKMMKQPDYYETYWAAEFSLRKRLTNKWMMDVSFTYQDHKSHYPTRASYWDPTDHLPVEKLDGQPMAYQASGSGSSDVFLNARWIFKVSGLYQLPYGFSMSGTLSARDGYLSPEFAQSEDYYRYDDELAQVYLRPFGETRDPNMYLLNLRLEKKFAIGEWGNLFISADGFNILNSNVRLARNRDASADNFGQTLCIMSPRIFRLGVRFEF